MISNDLRRFSAHTGVILNKLAIFAFVICVLCELSVFSAVFVAIAIMIWFCIAVSLLFVPLLDDGFRSFPSRIGDLFGFVEKVLSMVPIIATIGIIISILSIILMSFDFKWREVKKRFAGQIIILFLFVITLFICFIVIKGNA